MNTEVKQQIEQLLEPLLQNDKFFIVDVKVSLSKLSSKVTILLDSDEGIKIDECREISKSLGESLDALIPQNYTLEVSSPGVDVLLKSERMYRKNIGRSLKITLKDGLIINGKLESVDNQQIIIIEDKKRKKTEEVIPTTLLFDNIKESQVIISFK
jgi:ribosome maturation factor RimP